VGDAPWNRGLQPFGRSTGRRLPNFYYGPLHTHVSCPAYATYGCWKVEVVTRHACPHGVMVVVEETRNGGSEGASWGFSRRLAARTRTVVEVDRDQPGVSGRINSVLCTPDRS
jgi:hypothetical protein